MNNETENTAPATEAAAPAQAQQPATAAADPADPAVTARMAADPADPVVTDAVALRLKLPWKKAPSSLKRLCSSTVAPRSSRAAAASPSPPSS